MKSEAKRLRDLAQLHRDLAELVGFGREQRLAMAADLDKRAERLEGNGLDDADAGSPE